jgi:hypothetical protein
MGEFTMAAGKLLVDAYLWLEPQHRNKVFPMRLKKGTKISSHSDKSAVKNNQKIIISFTGNWTTDGEHEIKKGTSGHISSGKVMWMGRGLKQYEGQDIAKNGIPIHHDPQAELRNIAAEIMICLRVTDELNRLANLYQTKETSINRWRIAAGGLSGLQALAGLSIIGLSIAAIVITAGGAAPVLAAIAAAQLGTTIGAATAGASANAAKGMQKRAMYDSSHIKTNAGKDVVVTAGAVGAKKLGVHIVTNIDKAAGATFASGIPLASGALQVGMGGKGVYDAYQVDPTMVWNNINWHIWIEGLKQDLVKLTNYREAVPQNQKVYFTNAIKAVVDTLVNLGEKRPQIFQ